MLFIFNVFIFQGDNGVNGIAGDSGENGEKVRFTVTSDVKCGVGEFRDRS